MGLGLKQLSGYIVSVVGLIGIILSSEKVRGPLPIEIPEQLLNYPILLISGGVFVVGIVLVLMSNKSGSKETKKEKEVPIYKGDEIVGYRRD